MNAAIQKRLEALEQIKATPEIRVTEIQLINPKTGEVGAVIQVSPDRKK